MAELTVIVPSRGRPGTVDELVDTFRATCTAETALVFSIDSDDPERPQYFDALAAAGAASVDIVVADNACMADALNRVATAVNSFAVGFMGDDHRPRTVGWDAEYLNALRELGTGIVYGDDLLQRENLPTQVAITTDIVRALGWMTPPGMRHMYLDDFWRAIGAAAGCLRYLPNVVVEHVHPAGGKARMDEGYIRVNAPEVYEHDRQAYHRYLAERFRQDVATVKALRAVSHV